MGLGDEVGAGQMPRQGGRKEQGNSKSGPGPTATHCAPGEPPSANGYCALCQTATCFAYITMLTPQTNSMR